MDEIVKPASASSSNIVGSLSGSCPFHERLSITSTPLNGKNYAVGAKAVEVYYVGSPSFIS